jgi:hypothetical protein
LRNALEGQSTDELDGSTKEKIKIKTKTKKPGE